MRTTNYLRYFLKLIKHCNKLTMFGLAAICLMCTVTPSFAGKPTSLPYTVTSIADLGMTWGNALLDGGKLLQLGMPTTSWDNHCFPSRPDTEVYFFDGTATQELTSNYNIEEHYPVLRDGRAAWMGMVLSDTCQGVNEVFYYDGSSVRQISNNNNQSVSSLDGLQTHSGQVIWNQLVGDSLELFLYDGTATQQITSGGNYHWHAVLFNGKIALELFDGVDTEIYMWENSNLTQLTNNNDYDSIKLFDGRYLWISSGSRILRWDGISFTEFTLPYGLILDPTTVSNGQAVFSTVPPKSTDTEIFLWDGYTTRQLTNNRNNDTNPRIHNGQVAWVSWDGTDQEIYIWNGSNTYQLTNNTVDDILYTINNGQVLLLNGNAYYLATPK